MKKLMAVLVMCMLVLGVTACGNEKSAEEEEVKGAATCTIEMDGITTSMTFDAKGDVITKITQVSTMSVEGYKDDVIASIEEAIEDQDEVYSAIEGVTYSGEVKGDEMIETIIISTDEETLKTVIEEGLLPVDDEGVTQLSLEDTVTNLEKSGWTVE